ncbi:NUDIX hydrolase [Asticcacaulis machinosus]|uniref:NUDIX hydrolase n=1 Tax=Asticcacaulis machinosus TaxID=2984211 RepID=A0ABT5HF82_9CAUL|nr:NUDIX hydrolase [Asticcacaulis machinosus]
MQVKTHYPIPAIGVVCWRGDEVLLIRRGRAPRQGQWSIPGGKMDRFEPIAQTALRELREETGIEAELGALIEVYEIMEPPSAAYPDGFHYVLIDYLARWVSGEPVAGDDADQACFVTLEAALDLVVEDDLKDVLLKSSALRRRGGPIKL